MTENASPPETTHEGNPLRQTLELYQLRHYNGNRGTENNGFNSSDGTDTSQENWQKKLLAEYGNTMALLDAT